MKRNYNDFYIDDNTPTPVSDIFRLSKFLGYITGTNVPSTERDILKLVFIDSFEVDDDDNNYKETEVLSSISHFNLFTLRRFLSELSDSMYEEATTLWLKNKDT